MANVTIDRSTLYTISEFVDVIGATQPAPQFFKSTLFNQVENYWGQQAAVDFYRGSSQAAPFCTPYRRGIAVPRKKYVTSWVDIPDIKITRDIRAFDARYRLAGEAIGSKMSSQDRVLELQNRDYLELDLQISRREEVMCSDVLFSGRLLILDGEDNQPINEIDYGPINTTVIDPASYWDVAGSNPISDLQNMKRLVTGSGYPANLYVLGVDASNSFLNSEAVKESSNFLNYQQGQISPQQFKDFENFGISLLGSFWGMPIYSYDGTYTDPIDNQVKYFMPPDYALVASTAIAHRLAYGMVTQVEDDKAKSISDYQLPRVPQYVADAETDNLLFRLWSRPLPIPTDVLAWSVAKVCTLTVS
jgi:hypothetical protein